MDDQQYVRYAQELNSLRSKVAELTGELFEERSHIERLLRICRERSNADRNLRPKKTASGYVLISSVQMKHKWQHTAGSASDLIFNKGASRKSTYANIYRTILQTPYDYHIHYGLASEKILADLDRTIMPALGIRYRQDAEHNGEYRIWKEEDDDTGREACGIYSWALICRPPLWQVCIYHTQPIDFKEESVL